MTTKKICIACNEDGFGPSAFAYYVVRAITEAWRVSKRRDQLQIWVLNANAYTFNTTLYVGFPEVHVVAISSCIQLDKVYGEVDVTRSLARLSRYVDYRVTYARAIEPYLQGCHVALDIGVPLLARSAQQLGIPVITLFDHSWAMTLRGICSRDARYYSHPLPSEEDQQLAETIAHEIERDEAQATQVILFSRPITPLVFRHHWEKLGFLPTILSQGLGHRVAPEVSKHHLNALLQSLGQQPVPDDKPLILVSPGGTPIWDTLLQSIVEHYIDERHLPYMPILSRPNVNEEYKEKMRKAQNIRWFDIPKNSTQQILLPAFSLVITRAGGGIINDCLVCQTPFVCVEEAQWQVSLIEQECKELGLIPTIPEASWEIFKEDPVACIHTFVTIPSDAFPKGMFSGGDEKYIAEMLLSHL